MMANVEVKTDAEGMGLSSSLKASGPQAYNKESAQYSKQLIRTEPKIGINMMGVYAPETYFTSTELSKVIGEAEGKISVGLGIKKARLPTFSQSNATMAANALYKFIKMVESDTAQKQKFFEEPPTSIFFATESNADFSRPEGSVALGLVYAKLLDEDEERYRPYVEALKMAEMEQVTFACAGAGLSISNAVNSVYTNAALGKSTSALIISADTAVYDSKRAPHAEATQGAAASFMWITKNPALIRINYEMGFGGFNLPFPDFSKFGEDNPMVHGKFSEIGYVGGAALALLQIEHKFGYMAKSTYPIGAYETIKGLNANIAEDQSFMDMPNVFFVSHVPFPKQAIYFASFLYEHYMRTSHNNEFTEMQKRPDLGQNPLKNEGFTEMFSRKIKEFRGLKEEDIVSYIENDNEISAYWEWLGKLRKQPEFKEFLDHLRINDALKLPAEVGNSYTNSTIIAMASLLDSLNEQNYKGGMNGAAVFFGSGFVTKAMSCTIDAKIEDIRKNLSISIKGNEGIPLEAARYKQIHNALIKGDAKRSRIGQDENLVERDIKFLRGRLPEGFLMKRRNDDGTWEAEFVENGIRQELKPRL